MYGGFCNSMGKTRENLWKSIFAGVNNGGGRIYPFLKPMFLIFGLVVLQAFWTFKTIF